MPLHHHKQDELLAQARRVLREAPYSALEDVSCEIIRGSTAVLTGRAPSYFLKQVAQTAVASVPGIRQVINRVQVIGRREPAATQMAEAF